MALGVCGKGGMRVTNEVGTNAPDHRLSARDGGAHAVTYYIGIDPGQSGGIAVLHTNGCVLAAVKMPATDADLLTFLGAYNPIKPKVRSYAMLELVRSSPQMGVTSAFTFGQGYGAVRMALLAESIRFCEVTPKKWQTAMRCLTGGNKNVSKDRAQKMFPRLTVTHALADALLLAEYCRRIQVGWAW